MFSLRWQYLLGKSVAADVADREAAEWPPHPDRVFQALVASWGELGESDAGRAALLWLEALPPPSLAVPPLVEEAEPFDLISVVAARPRKVYVPVNDVGRFGTKGAPDLAVTSRPRKDRSFPAVCVDDATCALVWQSTSDEHLPALRELAAGVSRIGHSSSLVRCWVEESGADVTLVPAESSEDAEVSLRVQEEGRFRSLVRAFAEGGSAWTRPPTARWRGYRDASIKGSDPGPWSELRWILRRVAGDAPNVCETLAIGRALRSELITHCDDPDALEIVSGHMPDGTRLNRPHLAVLSLPFVGFPYADGHVLGLSLALPRSISPSVEDEIVRALARLLDPATDALELGWGRNRRATFVIEERETRARPRTLRATTWCRPRYRFASVTPVVLDRQPPRREKDRDEFVRNEIAEACVRAGFPRPSSVIVTEVAALQGVGPTWEFPPLPAKSGLSRRHVHVVVDFDRAVRGPVLIGAGRHRGLGMLMPQGGLP